MRDENELLEKMSNKYYHLEQIGAIYQNARPTRSPAKHGAELINCTSPDDGHKLHWFNLPKLGSPHDEARAKAVLDELVTAKIIDRNPMKRS